MSQERELVSKNAMVCPKCQGAMSQGFVADFGEGNVKVARWVEGQPIPGFFWEVRPDKSVHRRKTTTFRCQNCGYLEWYAVGPAE